MYLLDKTIILYMHTNQCCSIYHRNITNSFKLVTFLLRVDDAISTTAKLLQLTLAFTITTHHICKVLHRLGVRLCHVVE